MKDFVYEKMPKVYFGQGVLKKFLPEELKKVGSNVILAYGGGSVKKTGLYDEIMTILKENGKNVFELSGIMSNPTYSKVLEGAKIAKENNVDFILAVGGGSVMDCCKMVSAQACADEDIWKMEFVERKLPTKFIKLVISGAFDTLSHCMETYFGKPSENNVSDEITESIMRNVIRNIREVIKNPEDVNVRSELMWDSSIAECGLLKLGKITDFQAHQIEHQLGAYTNCNHGQGLAIIHPKLYRHIYKENISKFARFAVEVWKVDDKDLSQEETARKGIEELDKYPFYFSKRTTRNSSSLF